MALWLTGPRIFVFSLNFSVMIHDTAGRNLKFASEVNDLPGWLVLRFFRDCRRSLAMGFKEDGILVSSDYLQFESEGWSQRCLKIPVGLLVSAVFIMSVALAFCRISTSHLHLWAKHCRSKDFSRTTKFFWKSGIHLIFSRASDLQPSQRFMSFLLNLAPICFSSLSPIQSNFFKTFWMVINIPSQKFRSPKKVIGKQIA